MGVPTLRCVDLVKKYSSQQHFSVGGDQGGVSFDVEQGELFALLGPSGCGKTTTLRIIGGFVDPTSGRVELEGKDVTTKPPYARSTNTVFQSYALFPHLTVRANVDFGLKMDRVSRAERTSRSVDALEKVGMAEVADRKISELSGGQQQRVALARAMVKQPAVLLLDEPLGALDLRLRRQMQDELVRLKQSTGTTFVHVTHDQEEACAIADRVAVMNLGQIVQVDTPVALYSSPRTDFVAEFLNVGTVLRGNASRQGSDIRLDTTDLSVHGPVPDWATDNLQMCAVIPPDRVTLSEVIQLDDRPGFKHVDATVEHIAFTGSVFHVHLVVGRQTTRIVASVPREKLSAAFHPGAHVSASWHHSEVIMVEDTGSLVAVEPVDEKSEERAVPAA